MKELPAEFPGAAFEPIYTDEFLRRLAHRHYREHRDRVAAVVERICRHPFHLSHLLGNRHGLDWRGKRDRHVAGDLIIVFAICLECADRGFQAAGVNDCCDGPAPYRSNAIILLSLGSHKDLFARG